MTGAEYLAAIKKELEAGRHQHRMGESILAAFGYVRRRRSALDEINGEVARLGLKTDPLIGPDMPLRTPRIRFSLATSDTPSQPAPPAPVVEPDTEAEAEAEIEATLANQTLTASFRIAELAAAKKDVEWVSPNAHIGEAYTKMSLKKFSQLLVASHAQPRRQDVKGVVSYQSIAKALLNSGGQVTRVGECLDPAPAIVRSDADLRDVVPLLGTHDVVLVEGHDHRIQGLVTAWDLAEEFAQLVAPFKRIGEIEARLRALLARRLGVESVRTFLSDQAASLTAPPSDGLDELSIGELRRVVESPEHWAKLALTALDKSTFVSALDEIRQFRNRLMHFREPLNTDEVRTLANFCELVREIQA